MFVLFVRYCCFSYCDGNCIINTVMVTQYYYTVRSTRFTLKTGAEVWAALNKWFWLIHSWEIQSIDNRWPLVSNLAVTKRPLSFCWISVNLPVEGLFRLKDIFISSVWMSALFWFWSGQCLLAVLFFDTVCFTLDRLTACSQSWFSGSGLQKELPSQLFLTSW